MDSGTVQISVRGKQVTVPFVRVNGATIVVKGKLLKIAAIQGEEWVERTAAPDPSSCLEKLKSSGFDADLFSFAQHFTDGEPRFQFPYDMDNVAAIKITSYKEWLAKLSQESRRNIRTAEKKGALTRVAQFSDDFVTGIKSIYDETPLRQGALFWHYNKPLESVRRENSTYLDRSEFIGTYVGDELIGFIKMVYVGNAAQIMQILSKNCQFDKRPGNAMIAKAVEICASRGINYLVYRKYRYGKRDQSSLMEFKRRNGFEEIRFPRYYVPLTILGKISLNFGAHNGLAGILPRPAVEFLINVRGSLSRIKGKVMEKNTRFEKDRPTPA